MGFCSRAIPQKCRAAKSRIGQIQFPTLKMLARAHGNILAAWLILIPPITDSGGAMMGDNAWLLFSAVWIVTLTAAMIYLAFG